MLHFLTSNMSTQQKKVKIFAFPFAGGSKYSYRVLNNCVPANFEWETLELPGRGSRIHEQLCTTIEELAEDAFKQIKNRVHKQDYIIYGHSMGALLGYELSKKIIEAHLPPPVCLFLTGYGAPSVKKERKISAYDRKAFWREISDLGGLPVEILENEEMKDFFEPFLRSDFRAVENYCYQGLKAPLPVPIHIRTGSDELILWKDALKWQEESLYDIDLQQLPGDHFFIFNCPEHLIMQMEQAYLQAKAMSEKEFCAAIENIL